MIQLGQGPNRLDLDSIVGVVEQDCQRFGGLDIFDYPEFIGRRRTHRGVLIVDSSKQHWTETFRIVFGHTGQFRDGRKPSLTISSPKLDFQPKNPLISNLRFGGSFALTILPWIRWTVIDHSQNHNQRSSGPNVQK